MGRWYGRSLILYKRRGQVAKWHLIDFNSQGEGTGMASFYRATVGSFLASTDEELLAQLSIEYAQRGYTRQYSDQTLTWKR
ncbi:MAG TPA: hypothetical protein VGN43_14095, partial [Steroidobacteraceae bacterium]|nr:hypothetical protein [Steroidobacteraceae bacterium]